MRGPHVTRVARPSRGRLVVTRHGHCELQAAGLACGETPPSRGDLAAVRVGRRDGRPVLVEWLVGGRAERTAILAYDASGALIQLARLDRAGDIDSVRSYDPPGRRYTERNRDGSNALDGCGGLELELDDAGQVASETCLQWLGEPMRDTNGVTTTRYQRDPSGFVVRAERFGLDGAPLVGARDAVHRIDTERDGSGRPSVEHYLGIDSKPTPSAAEHGCFGLARDHERGQERRRRCIEADGRPRRDTDGVAAVEIVHDPRGCAVETRYVGLGGEAVLRDGVAVHDDTVDARCRVTVASCRDVDRDLVACAAGEPAAFHHQLDRNGRIAASTFIDDDGDAGVDPSYGAAEVRYRYDQLGRQVSESCHDASGDNIECARTGFHRTADTLDANGRIAERRFFATDGTAATNRGTVRRRYLYDNYDHLAEAQNLDEDGALVAADGMAIKRNYYDDRHRLFGLVLLDTNGQPAHYASCFTGVECPDDPWHAVRVVRSPDGRVTHNHYFDHHGKLMVTIDCRQDQCWGVD